MQAVHITRHGGPEVLELVELPEPEPGPGEVLVRVLAVSVNQLDLWVRRGLPGLPPHLPFVPGCDGTGEVVALGADVEGFTVGQRVVLLPGVSSGRSEHDRAGDDHLSDDYGIRGEHVDGLDRERVVLEARYLSPLPEGLDPIPAAAVPLVFLTAWGMLVGRARVRAGETVLVLGGSSGVGSAAIQLARHLGARVLATAGGEDKARLARDLGAEATVDHRDPDWPKEVRALTGGRGCDVVVEHVGPATWEGSMRSLARNGRLVTCGGTTGAKVAIQLQHLFIKNQSVLGSTMGPRTAIPRIFDLVAQGSLRPVVDRVLPLSEVRSAHRLLEERAVLGKLVLTPGR